MWSHFSTDGPGISRDYPPWRINFVNIPLRLLCTRGIKDEPSRVVWLAGRFIRISWRSSGIKYLTGSLPEIGLGHEACIRGQGSSKGFSVIARTS